jgi:imidazolonepropionase-like amidohydrolase
MTDAVPPLLIHAGQVFTATDADPVLRDAWVTVTDGRISEVGSSEPAAPTGAERIDAPDATLLPGLIDCHVHLSISGGPDWLNEITAPYAILCWRAERHAEATLRAGFTTVRTLGGPDGLEIALRDAQRQGLVTAPRIVPVNLAICMTGGHGSWLGVEVDGADEVRKAVRQQLKAGADAIKLIATGGVMTPGVEIGNQQLTLEEMSAAVQEAHKAGRRVAAHAHRGDGIRDAVLAGVDSIEHGSFLSDDLIVLMREHGTRLSATLVAAAGIADAPPNTVPSWARSKGEVAARANRDSFRRAAAAGVTMVLGTDAGTPYNFHGANARELALMVENGLPRLTALRAATRNGAELLGIADQVGTIEVGKQGDLVLCRGDAIQDPARLADRSTIQAVVQAGRIVR